MIAVTNLPDEVSEEEIVDLFNEFAEVKEI
jgi:RNA recognition motif-containing protein